MTGPGITERVTSRKGSTDNRHWHVVRRSPIFVALPVAIMCLLATNFVWESVRENVAETALAQWPLRFSLMDRPSTANLLGLFGGLMLARAQYARSIQPNFGYAWRAAGGDPYDWSLHFFNGGPGHAKILSVVYRVRFFLDPSDAEPEWIEMPDLQSMLASHGITRADADLLWLGRAPLVPQQRAEDGFLLGSFNYRALSLVDQLEIRILASDAAGDRHQLLIRITDRLPYSATEAVARTRTELAAAQ
ncbi:hypothetical protein ACQPYA_21430 [Micromonospora sp. CA-263727]|uniref:hypothetical protein n=1 Tax=Micromonospora sp. CA-263727 TaxID=3239967 RepID=UPI003D90F960